MARVRSGASTDYWTIDPTSKGGRVTLYDATGRAIAYESKATYMASGSFTPAATPTDLITIFGSSSKTVRVRSLKVGTANTAAGSQIFYILKRSAVNTTGTFVAATAVPVDSANSAATATSYGHYTANAGALGTSLGQINTVKVASPAVTPASFAGIVEQAQFEMLPLSSVNAGAGMEQPLTLRGVAEGLVVNFNGTALVAGQVHHYTIVWTEE
jgi:hypothetical protein